jgi:predicted SprT family Zn-dependent metalloprotease
MLLFKQLELLLDRTPQFTAAINAPASLQILAPLHHYSGRDLVLEEKAREILRALGLPAAAKKVRVEWNSRLRTCAGRADSAHSLISLNPRLLQHGESEVDRTFRHELAHLLAHFRAGRRHIAPHGAEWKAACRDLGIGDESRCHNLPFPVRRRAPRYLYRCPNCRSHFPRVRPVRRAIACLACCRKHSRGKYDERFRLKRLTR